MLLSAHVLSGYVRLVPNMRLKLAGRDRFKRSGVLCPVPGHGLSSTALAGGGLGPAA